MVDDDDDDFTYHVKQPTDKINMTNINAAVHSLITKERMQKLDLLVHLLSNLTQALVVCGPEGIGKTTLLDVLQERKTESLLYYFIQGNADLSFETIHGQLALDMSQGNSQSLSMTLKRYEDQHKQVVLLVDNAGELVPGLITAIIQYAEANPALRVVFALTHDELQMKRRSDRAVDDCHVVEIPPLSERQCGDFLQDLSTKPYANLSFKVISESMIAHIYRSTHGVPGRIIAEISGSSVAKPSGKLKWILALAVASAIAIAVGVQWLMSPVTATQSPKDNDKELIAPVEQKADNIEPQPESKIIPTLPPDQSAVQPVLAPSIAEAPINEAKDALAPSVEANANKDEQQPVALAVPSVAENAIASNPPEKLDVKVQPEPISAVGLTQKLDDKQSALAQQKPVNLPAPLQEKPKQPELTKAVNSVETPAPEKPAVKIQAEPMSTVLDQKQGGKPTAGAQQNKAEYLWDKQEELKKATLNKTANNIEPSVPAPNKLETIQIPQKPVEIATVSNGPVIETLVPQQVEPSSLPIATLPTPRDGGSVANGLEPLPPSPAQSDNNFTLQLIVLSKQSSADDVRKKYPAMEPDIRVIKTLVKGKEKFTLEYGSYSDAAAANKARQSLPFEFHNALVRKIVR
jgi:DamX protein